MAKKRKISKKNMEIKARMCPARNWAPILEDEEFKKHIQSLILRIDPSMNGEFLVNKDSLAYVLPGKDKIVRVYALAFLEGDSVLAASEPEVIFTIPY